MPLFEYEVVEQDGRRAVGMLAGTDSQDVARRLQARGGVPLRVSERQVPRAGGRGASAIIVARLCQDLASLLRAGMRIDDALIALAEAADLGPAGKILPTLAARVRAGQRLSEALAERPDLAPGYLVGLVAAGEETGDLAGVLEVAGRLAGRRAETVRSLKSSLTYPIILLTTAGISIGVLFTIVIPQLEPLFAGTEGRLPWVTLAVLAVSRAVREYGMIALIVLALTVLGIRLAMGSPAGRRWVDETLLRLPIIGPLVRAAQASQFARMISGLLAGGLVLEKALELAQGGLSNSAMRDAVSRVQDGVVRGERMGDSLAATGAFPKVVSDLARVGESGGSLPTSLARAADILEERSETGTKRLLAILGPAVTLLLGGLIALTVASVVLAIMSVNTIAQ